MKSVEGISPDFLFINILGYISYLLSLLLQYFGTGVREEYARRHSDIEIKHIPIPNLGIDNTVEYEVPTLELVTFVNEKNYPLIAVNDLAFVIHGLICTSITLLQYLKWKHKIQGGHRLSKYGKLIITTVLFVGISALAYIPICQYLEIDYSGKTSRLKTEVATTVAVTDYTPVYGWLDIAIILGNIKVCLSFSKYIPQLLHFLRRRSTFGWSILSTWLDLGGGVFSLLQLVIDAIITNQLADVLTGNFTKLGLACVTLVFYIWFIFLSWIYKDGKKQITAMNDF